MTANNRTITPLVLCGMVVGLAGLMALDQHLRGRNAPNRAALARIHDSVQPGDGYDAVLHAYWKHATPDLITNLSSPSVWWIGTPGEIGATNWVLDVRFEEGKVASVRMRTGDGPPPLRAPVDKEGR